MVNQNIRHFLQCAYGVISIVQTAFVERIKI